MRERPGAGSFAQKAGDTQDGVKTKSCCAQDTVASNERPNHAWLLSYLPADATMASVACNCEPSSFTAAMIATDMPAAIKPYSMAVAPDLSQRNCLSCPYLTPLESIAHRILVSEPFAFANVDGESAYHTSRSETLWCQFFVEVNRMKAALVRLGIRGFNPKLRNAVERFDSLLTPEGDHQYVG